MSVWSIEGLSLILACVALATLLGAAIGHTSGYSDGYKHGQADMGKSLYQQLKRGNDAT